MSFYYADRCKFTFCHEAAFPLLNHCRSDARYVDALEALTDSFCIGLITELGLGLYPTRLGECVNIPMDIAGGLMRNLKPVFRFLLSFRLFL